MIRALFLEYFQSIKEPTVIPFSPITLAFGPNSSGKSAVLDALDYLATALGAERPGLNDPLGTQYLRNRYREKFAGFDPEGLGPWAAERDLAFAVGVAFDYSDDLRTYSLPSGVASFTDATLDQASLELLRALKDRLIHIELRGPGGNVDGPGTKISIAVDGVPLLICDQSVCYELDDKLALSPLGAEAADRFTQWNLGFELLDGAIHLNLRHPTIELGVLDGVFRLDAFSKHDSPFVKIYVDSAKGWLTLRDVHFGFHQLKSHEFFAFSGNATGDQWSMGFLAAYGKYSDVTKLSQDCVDYLRAVDASVTQEEKWGLAKAADDVCENLSLVLLGLFHLAKQSLDSARVSGSRSIVSEDDSRFDDRGSVASVPHLHQYGRYRSGYYAGLSEDVLQGDFVNLALANYLPSLNGVQIDVAKFKVTPIGRVRIRHGPEGDVQGGRIFLRDAQGRQLRLSEVGSGISYVLPILTSIWAKNMTLVEQPELHLHPAAQCEVADVVIAAHKNGRQIFLETHSEHLILRLLRRIRETSKKTIKHRALRLRPNDLCVLYFQPNGDGTTRVLNLRVDVDGDFVDRWPGGFFAERERELFGE